MSSVDLGRVVGESAYETAVKAGYSGTEAAFGAALTVPPCNRNLLDNWYFLHPVNQPCVQGTVIPGGPAGTPAIFIDRWRLLGTAAVTEGGVSLNGTLTQTLEQAVGQAVTATVLTASGIDELVPVYDDSTRTLTITATGQTIRAVKLELGSVQTLAHQDASGAWVLNEIPDYGQELARCQRFCCLYRAQGGSGVTNNVLLGAGLAVSATTARVVLHTPVPLRAKPTVSMAGLGIWCGGQHTAVTAAEVLWGAAGNCVALQLTCESGAFTPQAPCMLEFLTADGWLDLSAEL